MRAHDFLGSDGIIARSLPHYEFRQQQLEMANAVENAFASSGKLMVEAGTGIGKSFAYLVPAALWSMRTKERAVISTLTINLQEQLINKDIPFLNSIDGIDVKACLAKGKGNYVCLRRLFGISDKNDSYLDCCREDDYPFIKKIEDWYNKGKGDGSLSTIDFEVPQRVWSNVKVETEACPGKRCRYFSNCPYFLDREKWEASDILVVNHSLFFTDAAMRYNEVPFLPGFGAVVFDEAHSLEDVASKHFGINISKRECLYRLRKIFDDRTNRGFFNSPQFTQLQTHVIGFKKAIEDYFSPIEEFRKAGKSRLRTPGKFPPIRDRMDEIFLQELAGSVKAIDEESDFRPEAEGLLQRMREMIVGIGIFNNFSADDCVYWVDGSPTDPRILSTPVRVDKHLNNYVWKEEMPHILTSATLATGNNRAGCSYIRDRLGIAEIAEKQLGSPFDYQNQAAIYIPRDMPDPTRDTIRYREGLVKYILHFVKKSEGKAFVLFTSLADMKFVHSELHEKFVEMGLLVLVQDGELPRHKMLELFREDGKAVLLGVSSFWQGVDVRGEALSNVIITRLPFEVPDHPVVEARREEIAARGRSDFMEYSLPNAILKLKQGFGRLIRTNDDKGFVVILDPRVLTKRYGRMFINALPKCPVITNPEEF